MTKSWKISRRTLLRGLGATLALPALDIMNTAKAGQAAGPPLRFLSVFQPNGVYPKHWEHLVCKEHTPLADLHLTLAQKLDLEMDEFNGATKSTIAGL
jgi:hypothetical protein